MKPPQPAEKHRGGWSLCAEQLKPRELVSALSALSALSCGARRVHTLPVAPSPQGGVLEDSCIMLTSHGCVYWLHRPHLVPPWVKESYDLLSWCLDPGGFEEGLSGTNRSKRSQRRPRTQNECATEAVCPVQSPV